MSHNATDGGDNFFQDMRRLEAFIVRFVEESGKGNEEVSLNLQPEQKKKFNLLQELDLGNNGLQRLEAKYPEPNWRVPLASLDQHGEEDFGFHHLKEVVGVTQCKEIG